MSHPYVLFIITKLELGGAQKVCLSLMRGLKKRGVRCGLLSGKEGVLVDEVSKEFSDVYLLDSFKREISIWAVWREVRTFFKLISLISKIKKKHPNLVVHTHSTKAGLVGRWAAFLAGAQVRVHTVHGFGFHEYQSKLAWLAIYFLELLVAPITTHFVCVSSYDVRLGSKLLPTFKKKNSIIRAAIEWERFMPSREAREVKVKDRFVFGSISCFKPQKNLFDLLEAFKLVCLSAGEKSKKLLLQIIGDGALRPDIEKWIKKNQLQDKIDLLGWQSDVASWLRSWDAYVQSSLWEGLPCAIIEARVSGLPVVAYDVGGIGDFITDGKNGFLIDPKNYKGLAEKMELLFVDSATCSSLSSCEDEFSSFKDNFMVEKHIELYRSFFKAA